MWHFFFRSGLLSIFLISVILQVGCYEVESNIVSSRMCLLARRIRKKGENKNIKWENSRDRYGCMVLIMPVSLVSIF